MLICLETECTYRLMYAATVESLHSSLGRSWIVVFHKAVVQALALELGK
jgi:hypothetical protein